MEPRDELASAVFDRPGHPAARQTPEHGDERLGVSVACFDQQHVDRGVGGEAVGQTAGEGRLSDQPPDLVIELVELCGRLPLAIRIAAARLGSHPAWSLLHLVQLLRDQQNRLSELEAGQRSVTATLDLPTST